MGYLYIKVDEAEFELNTPLRKKFKKHLEKVAEALRAIEWNDSGDGAGSEEDMIMACLYPTIEDECLDASMYLKDAKLMYKGEVVGVVTDVKPHDELADKIDKASQSVGNPFDGVTFSQEDRELLAESGCV